MKIAILSDIHGNLTALESILSEIRETDDVVCLGDVAASGPQPSETLSFLRNANWQLVLGNTDETLAKKGQENLSNLKMPKDEKREMFSLHQWTASQINGADRKFLAGFRHTIEVEAGGRSLLCYHGSPRSNTEKIVPTISDSRLSEIFSGRSASIYAGGHTHEQMVRKYGASLIINPGSVGLPFFVDTDGTIRNPIWAEYAVITISRETLKVDLRRTRYSHEDLKEAVRSSGMPNPTWWLRDWVKT